MITDRELMFSIEQAVTGDANGTDVVDLVAAGDVSRGRPLRFRAQVTTAMDSAGEAATLEVQLVTADSADLSSNPTIIYRTGAMTEANLSAAGTIIADVVVPKTSQRYIGVKYDNGGEVFTTGKITAGLVLDTETAMGDRPTFHTGL